MAPTTPTPTTTTDFDSSVDDFDMSTIDAMPSYINDVKGVFGATLTLSRDTDKVEGTDRLIFDFVIDEVTELREGEATVADMMRTSYSLIISEKEKAKNATQPSGLRMAKPLIEVLRAGLKIESGKLNDIINECKGVKVSVTVSSRKSKVAQPDGTSKEYVNLDIKRLSVL